MIDESIISGMSKKNLLRLDQFLQKNYINNGKLSGLVMAVYRKNNLLQCSSVGYMDKELRKPMTRDTIFRIYSMTKPITSVALMQLYEKGLFRLNDPVSKYINNFDSMEVFQSGTSESYKTQPSSRDITIRDLLTHQSGLSYGLTRKTVVDQLYQDKGILYNNVSLKEKIKLLCELPLEFSPGEYWNYSVSTDVCGYLIELMSGLPLDKYFIEYIFDPLEMQDTSFYVSNNKLDRLACNYEFQSCGLPTKTENPIYGDYTKSPIFLSGGSGLVSTIDDYMNFCQMILKFGKFKKNQILNKKTIELMSENHLGNPNTALNDMVPMNLDLRNKTFDRSNEGKYYWNYSGVGFGLGFAVLLDNMKTQSIGSVGQLSWGGYASTTFFIDHFEDMAVVFLTQLLPSESYNVSMEIRNLIYSAIVD
jgi:CubicO group peptidase (beta-lactamase class C family)